MSHRVRPDAGDNRRPSCRSAARGGRISLLGIPPEDVAIPMKQIVLYEVEIVGNRANPNCAEDSIRLVDEGRVTLSDMMTHEFLMKDYEQAFKTFTERLDNSIKVGIHPNL